MNLVEQLEYLTLGVPMHVHSECGCAYVCVDICKKTHPF